MSFEIKQIFTNSPLRNFSYLLEGAGREVICVDPWDAQQILDHMSSQHFQLKAIINTHEHWDHTKGNSELVAKTGCQVWAHEKSANKIEKVDRFLREGERIPWGEGELEVLDTPGHTFAHLCLLCRRRGREEAILTGDTFFNAGVGNCHNGGDPGVLFQTIQDYFRPLPDHVVVYPGHDYLENNLNFTLSLEAENISAGEMLKKCRRALKEQKFINTTMAEERRFNLFLKLKEIQLNNKIDSDLKSEKQVFLHLRELRNHW